MEYLINTVLFALLAVTAGAVVHLRSLFAAVMLAGIYSLLTASIFVILDAVDVAFTEAAVGAGISTILMLAALALTGREQTAATAPSGIGLAVVLATGAALVWGTLDMPHFGDPLAPAHVHVAPRYLEGTVSEIGIPNAVTSVLASYRGYDTLGEVFVIFTAGIGPLVLLGNRRGN